MITRKVSSQGFELNWSVPASVEEYSSLAPKRENPALEDAILSTWYRTGANTFRDRLCEMLEKETGVARLNSGTEDEPKWEQEGKYRQRCAAEWAKGQGLDPASKAAKDGFVSAFQGKAQAILDAIKFDPSEKEATGSLPQAGKRSTAFATEMLAKGIAQNAAAALSKVLGREVVLNGADNDANIKILATAIAENEKRKREIEDARARAEYGLTS